MVAVHADLDEALQEWVPPRLHRPTRYAHAHADGALAVAAALVDPLVRNGLPAGRIRVVRNGIDLAAVRDTAGGPGSLLAVRADDAVPVVVATGRLAPQKGYDLLLRAHAQVVGDAPHRVLVLNDGPELAALQRLTAELGVSDTVEFAGADAPLLPTVADADLFVLPSRHEGLPLALLEAVALGVPSWRPTAPRASAPPSTAAASGSWCPWRTSTRSRRRCARTCATPAPCAARPSWAWTTSAPSTAARWPTPGWTR